MVLQQQLNDLQTLLSSSDLPVLVVFSAPWCGPSHLMDVVLEQINESLKSQLQIVKVDAEKNPDLANQYQVHPLPTLILFKQGQPVATISEEKTETMMSAKSVIQRLQNFLES